jgi:ABC-type sugar transport system permease subunit
LGGIFFVQIFTTVLLIQGAILMANEKGKKTRKINYNNWGYFFIAPFFVVFVIFQLIPLITTIGNSFFENYRVGLMQVGPTFNGLQNFHEIFFGSDVPRYALNTMIMWISSFHCHYTMTSSNKSYFSISTNFICIWINP